MLTVNTNVGVIVSEIQSSGHVYSAVN